MDGPDFFTALYAAVLSVRDRETNEAEVSYEVTDGDRIETLTATVRRFDFETAVTE